MDKETKEKLLIHFVTASLPELIKAFSDSREAFEDIPNRAVALAFEIVDKIGKANDN